MLKKTRVLLACAILFSWGSTSHARVFRRWSAAAQSTRALEAAGGKIAYEAPVVINGGKASLVVLVFNSPIEAVVRDLRSMFNLDSTAFSGGNMGMATSVADHRVLRFLALQLPGQDRTLVFKIEQSREESGNSSSPPARHMMESIPPFPQAEPVLYMKDENAGMGLAVAKTAADPANVLEFYRDQLTRQGWKPALASSDTPAKYPALDASNFRIYHRGPEVCCIYVDSSAPGETRITVLHKQRGMK